MDKLTVSLLILTFIPIICAMYYFINKYKKENQKNEAIQLEEIIQPLVTRNEIDENNKLNLITVGFLNLFVRCSTINHTS